MPITCQKALRYVVLSAVAIFCNLSYAGEADALAITTNIQARHLPFGTVMDPVFASADSTQIVGYTRCGDSALWTGHYLAAEAFRYNVTRAPDALANVKAAIVGLKGLADVTGNNLLARCLVVEASPFAAGIEGEEAANGIHPSPPYSWIGNTSRDQYSGAVFGLGLAYDLVDDAGVKDSASDLLTRLVSYLDGHNWSVFNTTFLVRPDQILAFLQVARHLNPNKFSTSYDIHRVTLALGVSIAIGVDTSSDDSYFKFNLDYINLFGLIRLESSDAKSIYGGAYDVLRHHTAGHQNAFFNMIDRALTGPNAARDAETIALLNQWLLRPRRDKYVDVSGVVPVCGNQACQPVPLPMRPPTDFIWQRNPFQLTGGAVGAIENAGIDYILPYWMARYYGVLNGLTVQSAAAISSSVAPNSIASIYGSNPASATEQAAAIPLPNTLGGVTVNVQDAAGVQRPASLIYASPTQINFIVPDGTSSGTATFKVAKGNQVSTATATIQSIAPTLFSMNGNGIGVAAATAVRTQAGNSQNQFPVPVFQCTASGCVSLPIDVGLDTPVFLTLYGTGIRNRTSLANVKVTINGISVPVQYAGPQPSFAGLDQVNVPLTLNLRGSGESNVLLTVDGQTSNTVTVNIK